MARRTLNARCIEGRSSRTGIGYTFDAAWKPRIGVEYNYVSGDGDPLDGDIGTFQNLFPTNHKFYGFMDVFSWQHMHNPAISLKAAPCKPCARSRPPHAPLIVSPARRLTSRPPRMPRSIYRSTPATATSSPTTTSATPVRATTPTF